MIKYKLGELIDINNGTKYNHLKSGDIPVYGSGGIMCYVDNFLYDGEAILLPRKGTLSNIMFTKGKIWTVDTMYYATVTDEVNAYFLYNHLSILNLEHLDSGSALPSMTKSAYQTLEVSLPNKEVQDKVASILFLINQKIALNNRINQQLEAMAKLLYDYWFVQFDFPDKNGKPYKSSGGKMVYNEVLKREIPEGWEETNISHIAETGSGGTPLSTKIEYYENGNIAWINSGEVNAPFIVKAEKFITELGLNSSNTKIYKQGTILMAMYGATAGKVSLMDIEACTNQAICAIIPKKVEYKIYIKFALQNMYKYLINLSSGSARDNLSQNKIKNLSLPSPAPNVLNKYHDIVNPLMEKILTNLKENQHLTTLRDWLLPMLMNGQVRVE